MMLSSHGIFMRKIPCIPHLVYIRSNGNNFFAIFLQLVMNQALKFEHLTVFGLLQMKKGSRFSMWVPQKSKDCLLGCGPFFFKYPKIYEESTVGI